MLSSFPFYSQRNRLRKAKWFAQGHTGGKWQSWWTSPDPSSSKTPALNVHVPSLFALLGWLTFRCDILIPARLQCIFSGTWLLLLEPFHEASSHEALVGEDIQEIMKENNSHWRNRCWSASVPVSAHCAEREAQVTPRYGWYFLPGSPTSGVCGTCGQGHFWRLDTQGFLCNMLVDLSL